MYDANLTYEENYERGPFAHLQRSGEFPKIKYTTAPAYNFLGIPLHTPCGVPAGPLLNSKFVNVALDAGFCLPTYKTVRSNFYPCHAWPNVLLLESQQASLFSDEKNKVIATPFEPQDYFNDKISISNSFGVPSQDNEVWARDFKTLLPYSRTPGTNVVLSFQATVQAASSPEESKKKLLENAALSAMQAAQCVTQAGFSLLEINLSCPNEKHLPIYKDIPAAVELLSVVHDALKNFPAVKIIAKIGALSAQEAYEFLSQAHPYVDAISAVNTVSAEIYGKKGEIILGNKSVSGGTCGHLILEQGLKMAALLAETRAKLNLKKNELGLIGVGGVCTARDCLAYLNCGVDVVQAATGMMWNLNLAQEIAAALNVPYCVVKEK